MDATTGTIEQAASEVTAPARTGPIPTHDRLAELVMHLTDCPAPLAIAAVNEAAGDDEPESEDERLFVVARAMVSVKHGIDLRG